MVLPVVNGAVYEVKLLSVDEPVQFRAYTVGQEKALHIAIKSNDPKIQSNTLAKIIQDCVLSDVDIKELPNFDFEHLFMQIRCMSKSQIAEFSIEEKHHLKGDTSDAGKNLYCENTKIDFKYDLSSVKPIVKKKHDKSVRITDELTVTMKYPSAKLIEEIKEKSTPDDFVISIIAKCIDTIWVGDVPHSTKGETEKELRKFVESLTEKQFNQIMVVFFETMPRIEADIKGKCLKCGYCKTIECRGLFDFLGLPFAMKH